MRENEGEQDMEQGRLQREAEAQTLFEAYDFVMIVSGMGRTPVALPVRIAAI